MTQDLNSFGEIITHAQCSADEKNNKYMPCVPHKINCKKKDCLPSDTIDTAWYTTGLGLLEIRYHRYNLVYYMSWPTRNQIP